MVYAISPSKAVKAKYLKVLFKIAVTLHACGANANAPQPGEEH